MTSTLIIRDIPAKLSMRLVMIFLYLPSLINNSSPVQFDSRNKVLQFVLLVDDHVCVLRWDLSLSKMLTKTIIFLSIVRML